MSPFSYLIQRGPTRSVQSAASEPAMVAGSSTVPAALIAIVTPRFRPGRSAPPSGSRRSGQPGCCEFEKRPIDVAGCPASVTVARRDPVPLDRSRHRCRVRRLHARSRGLGRRRRRVDTECALLDRSAHDEGLATVGVGVGVGDAWHADRLTRTSRCRGRTRRGRRHRHHPAAAALDSPTLPVLDILHGYRARRTTHSMPACPT